MTEDEAKTAPCIRASGHTLQDNGPCIGSACKMAWRWDDVLNQNYKAGTLASFPNVPETPMYIKSTTDGHCGLAGRP